MNPSNLSSLPIELIDKIVLHVPQRSDLATLRLTSQMLNAISTPYYFATVPIFPDWDEDSAIDGLPFPNQVEYHPRYFASILDSEKLKKLVRKVEIYLCNPDCDHHPHACLHRGWMPKPVMSAEWVELYERLPELPRLESVSLVFDRHGGGDDLDDDMILHGYDFRSSELADLLSMLEKRIKDLSVRHIQLDRRSYGHGHDHGMKISFPILVGLRALRLSFVHEQPRGESGTVYKSTDCHEQWSHFTSGWLEPAKTLRHLTLYSDIPTGWFPKVDFCNVHFAQLQSLALGQFVFCDDRHFKWIVDHSETLQELYFDHCSIIYQSGASLGRNQWLDEQGYPKIGGEDEFWAHDYSILPRPDEEHVLTLESYAVRWSDAFELFSKTLTRLRTFRFGTSSQWNFDTPNRHDDGCPGHPIMPWEAERDLKTELFEERYLVYNDWGEEYIVRWKDASEDVVLNEQVWTAEELARFEEYPQCTGKDESTLKELLGNLGVTWHAEAESKVVCLHTDSQRSYDNPLEIA
ncbi:uncharacterized protein CC84DRAFT_1262603 [Paraphaeosphaeria sporulosa]|uniref:F-box domain-containing protein n=1 Tax=Paraphaeosphaeria sporulosa TaxID=1460663 RepID=A0A177C3S8_9PLEO|nr:uncharacterized protein CC84DRAFT_1262603 [Paraphaeosphaeria sporulosa]OAG01549.1 hypothetical protein CC84DRAFT_1262603 [Paraphaeosphaeria sporulosa]